MGGPFDVQLKDPLVPASDYYDHNHSYDQDCPSGIGCNNGMARFHLWPAGIKIEDSLGVLYGPTNAGSNDSYLTNMFKGSVFGSLKDVHLIKDFFTISAKLDVFVDTAKPTNMFGANAALSFLFYLSDPSKTNNILRFGVSPAQYYGGIKDVWSYFEQPDQNISDGNFSYGNYRVGLSFLWFNKAANLGLFTRLYLDAYGEGSLSWKKRTQTKENGETDIVSEDMGADFVHHSFGGDAELFWMPFYSDSDDRFWGRNFTVFASAEAGNSWLNWEGAGTAAENGLVDSFGYAQCFFGLRYGVGSFDRGSLLNMQ